MSVSIVGTATSTVTESLIMTIKKAFIDVHQLLLDNQNRKVSTIMPELLKLMEAKTGGSDIGATFIKNDDDTIKAVYCYYHKKWELVAEVEYGAKKGTATGLNTMCKEGTKHWTKQQRQAKRAKEQLLDDLSEARIELSDLADLQAEIESTRQIVTPREDNHGFDTVVDLDS